MLELLEGVHSYKRIPGWQPPFTAGEFIQGWHPNGNVLQKAFPKIIPVALHDCEASTLRSNGLHFITEVNGRRKAIEFIKYRAQLTIRPTNLGEADLAADEAVVKLVQALVQALQARGLYPCPTLWIRGGIGTFVTADPITGGVTIEHQLAAGVPDFQP